MDTFSNIQFVAACIFFIGCSGEKTFDVGPGESYATLSEVAGELAAGDEVRIHGGTTYTEDVTLAVSGGAEDKITIRGVPLDGRPPVLSGAIFVEGDHMMIEGLEIRDGDPACLRHGGHDLTVRDTVVHDCPSHGILGTDEGSGSLTLERVEVYNTAYEQTGNAKHQIYIATDEVAHPGSVFRMQLCFVHDAGIGGSNVKSRAERTEIYSNWIENGGLYELELYGPDEDAVPGGWSENLAREDADVVGNVFYRTHEEGPAFLFRVGGDGSGELGDAGLNDSKGRVRFAYNTVIVPTNMGIFRTFNRLESIEVHNNVFYSAGGGLRMLEDEARWMSGSQLVVGAHNWVSVNTAQIPAGFTDTLTADDPQLANLATGDLSPGANSMLVDAGASPTVSPAGYEFPNPLQLPFHHPPIPAGGEATLRRAVGTVDIGAFEYGVPASQPEASPEESAASGCQLAPRAGMDLRWLVLASALLLRRRSRRMRPISRSPSSVISSVMMAFRRRWRSMMASMSGGSGRRSAAPASPGISSASRTASASSARRTSPSSARGLPRSTSISHWRLTPALAADRGPAACADHE